MSDVPSVHVAPVKTVFQALADAKSAIGAVRKTERNAQQGFNFRGIDAVVTAAAPALNKEGIITVPRLDSYTYETVEVGQKKTPMGHVMVRATYSFYGPAGDSVDATVLAESFDSGDKACAKAMSVAYRIALLQTLNLPTDEPDPDSQSYERSAPAEVRPLRSSRAAARAVPAAAASAAGDDFFMKAKAAADVSALREVWKQAGVAGKLQDKGADPDTGEAIVLQDYLYRRNDSLSLPKSTENS